MRKGQKHTEEAKEKLRQARLRQTFTEESYLKIIETKRANGTLTHSEETRKKISEAQKKLSPEKRERINHGIRHNRYNKEYAKKLSDTKLGEINPSAKLTVDKVIQIKQLWKTGNYTTTTLGEKFEMSRQAINDIVRGRTWKHVEIDKEEE